MLKKLLIVVVVLLAIVLLLATRDWDSPELGQALLDKAGEATGIQMTATGFGFNLFKGVRLSGVEASQKDERREFSFTLDELIFEHRLLPLLSGTVAVDRIVFERPQFELVEPADKPSGEAEPKKPEEKAPPAEEAPPADDGDGAGFALEVNQILINDGTVVMKKKGEDGETRIEQLNFEMQNLKFDPTAESLAALSADGELSIGQVLLGTLTMTTVESQFTLASAVFDLLSLTFSTPHGKFAGEMQVDFNPVPFKYTLNAQGDPLDLNSLVGANDGFGPGTAKIEAEGVGSDTKDVKASGNVLLTEGQFPAADMFTGVDKALGKQVLVGTKYEATEAKFQLANNVVTLSPFQFTSEVARLDLDGSVNLEGPIALGFAVATPREGITIEGVGSDVLDVLADDEGWVPVPISVTGTLEDPKVRPDSKALLAQAGEGLKREAKEAAGDALRGFLNKKN